ncbi:hypothetical protein COEREDRAFT_80120, partial [Coemansia reversa NRRL 1564]
MDQFVDALDPENPTIRRLMCAVVKETLAPRRPSESASPAASMHGGVPIHGSFRSGCSPAMEGAASWMGTQRSTRNGPASVDLDHVRNLMEAIEIVSPHIVGAEVGGGGSPIPEMRSGWTLPGQAAQGISDQSGTASSLGAGGDPHLHAMRQRRTSGQPAHSPGIPIRPARLRGRGGHINPVEFAEYAVAHMRHSPRFTPMGHGHPLGSSVASDSRSLPRSFRGAHSGLQSLHFARQQIPDGMRNTSVPGVEPNYGSSQSPSGA